MKIKSSHKYHLYLSLITFLCLNLTYLSASKKLIKTSLSYIEIPFLIDTIPSDENIIIVDRAPRFPGCENFFHSKEKKELCAQKKLLEYIYGNLKYPEEAIKNNTEGKVIITFIVEKDGSLGEIELVQDLEDGCGEAALKVVENMNKLPKKWTPGKHNGKKVRVSYTLPVKFKLTD